MTKSNFPISMNRPPRARHRTEAMSFSSDRELRTRSTPRPQVSTITICSKEQSRELPMWLSFIWQIKNKIYYLHGRLAEDLTRLSWQNTHNERLILTFDRKVRGKNTKTYFKLIKAIILFIYQHRNIWLFGDYIYGLFVLHCVNCVNLGKRFPDELLLLRCSNSRKDCAPIRQCHVDCSLAHSTTACMNQNGFSPLYLTNHYNRLHNLKKKCRYTFNVQQKRESINGCTSDALSKTQSAYKSRS